MNDKTNDKDEDRPEEKAAVTLSGTVEKIIPPITQLLPTSRRKRKSTWKARKTFTKKYGSTILCRVNQETKLH
jgi:hypothetical protein